MTLEDWRRARDLTFEELGRQYGVAASAAFVHCLPLSHERAKLPRPEVLSRIFKMTRGEVTPNDFYTAVIPALRRRRLTASDQPRA